MKMTIKIFVGKLAEGTTSDEILHLFEKHGKVAECDVITNYGFVHMETEDEANAAIAALDGFNLNGARIHVELSTANTQGRKRRNVDDFSNKNGRGPSHGLPHGGLHRFEPYRPPRREMRSEPPMPFPHGPPCPSMNSGQQSNEEFASEQVKDLLELYFRDPVAFDQYARTYYYGERMERMARKNIPVDPYYRPDVTNVSHEFDRGPDLHAPRAMDRYPPREPRHMRGGYR